jgi:hypothetical protein
MGGSVNSRAGTATLCSNHAKVAGFLSNLLAAGCGRNRSRMMQKLIALGFVLAGIAFAAPAPGQGYTDEERQACEADAFRLCGNAIPDQERVKACLITNMSKLTPACRRMFQRGR